MLRVLLVTCIALGATLLAACSDNGATTGPTDEPTATEGAAISRAGQPTESPTPTPELGSWGAPAPVGITVSFNDVWDITVVSVLPDANAVVKAENQSNSPPAAGNQFFLATVSVKYSGEDSGTFKCHHLKALGPSHVGYAACRSSCGRIPDGLRFDQLLSPGTIQVLTGGTVEEVSRGTIQGNVCWEVPSTDAGELVMSASELPEQVYWSLTPS